VAVIRNATDIERVLRRLSSGHPERAVEIEGVSEV
jgi:hypothetical protein